MAMAKEIETERCRVSARNPLREFLDIVRTRRRSDCARSFLRKLLDVRDDFLGELAGGELLGVLELAL